MNSTPDGIRKAAILLRVLDGPAAQLLWERLTPAQTELVRKAQSQLGEVSSDEERRVLDEFLRLGVITPKQAEGGLDLATLAEHRRTTEDAPSSPSSSSSARAPFGSLYHVEVESLVRALTGERPQTVAVVLAHLPSRQAAGVLQRLEPDLQKEVVSRLVRLEETPWDILQEVEAVLRARLSQQISIPRRRVAGLATLAGILQTADLQTSRRILAQIDALDPALADRLSSSRIGRVRWEDLIELEAISLRRLMTAADFEVAVLALTGADPALVDRVVEVIPEADAQVLKSRLQNPGPIRLRDVEEARRRLAALAERLAEQGHIRLPTGLVRSEHPLAA